MAGFNVTVQTSAPPAGFTDDPSFGFRGVNYSANYGTTADYFVDGVSGSDANNGTSLATAFATIGQAMSVATSGNVVAVVGDGVKYREKFTLPNGVTIQGYNGDFPEITGFASTGNGTVCTSPADDAILGATLAGSGNVAKWTFTHSGFDYTNLMALNPRENGTPLYCASDRLKTYSQGDDVDTSTRPYRVREDDETWHNADGYSAGTFTDSSVINSTNYTDAELARAYCMIYQSPNTAAMWGVASSNVAANTFTLTGSPTLQTHVNGQYVYQLLNVARGMVQGTWIVVDHGDGTCTLYAYLNDIANINNVEVSARESVISLPATLTTAQTIRGLHLSGASGDNPGTMQGALIRRTSNGSVGQGPTIENVVLSDTDCVGYQVAGGIWLLSCENTYINQVTIRDMPNQSGWWNNGSSQGNMADTLIRRSVVMRTGFAPFRWYSISSAAGLHNYARNCGHKAHGNLTNAYISGTWWMLWGNEFRMCQGYAAVQSVANFVYAFNLLDTFSKFHNDDRTLIDQGSAAGTSYIFNNTIGTKGNTGNSGYASINLASSGASTHNVWNNVCHGVTYTGDFNGGVGTVENNVLTKLPFSASLVRNTLASDYPNDVVQTNHAAVFTDALNGDLTAVNASSPIKTTVGTNLSSIVTTIAANFPAVSGSDLTLDYKGNSITWTDQRVGADWQDAA